MPVEKPHRPLVVPRFTKKEIALGVAAGAALFALIAWGVVALSRQLPTQLTGRIVSKTFVPQPETQITIGKAGLHERRVEGDYIFEVRVERDNRTYSVWVDKPTYDSRNVGDEFSFPRPKD
jgi:hypothetical protein